MKRRFDASPQRVFRAFADPAAKAPWFTGAADMWQLIERVTDFRIGGREVLKGTWSQGGVTSFDAVYHDIVADQHILCGYNRLMDMRKLSLATIEIRGGRWRRRAESDRTGRLPGWL